MNGIGAVASLVFLLAAVDQKKDFILPLITGVVCVVAVIINIGISQLIIFVGETAYNTKILRIIAEHKMSVNDTEDPS